MSGLQDYPCRFAPTVYPAKSFDPQADAEALCNAMKGIGANKKAIINILCSRSMVQRLEIAVAFNATFEKNLVKKLKSVLNGDLSNLVIALMTPLPYLYVKDLRDAAMGISSDEETIIEILCTSNYGIRTIISFYERIYGKRIQFHLNHDTAGHFKRLCEALCKAERDENPDVDEEAATADAEALVASEGKWAAANSVLKTIIIKKSYQHLLQVFATYEAMTGVAIEESIKKELTGSIAKGMLAIVKCIRSKVGYLAERLYYSMKGLGTNDKTIIRIIIGRSEIDLEDIKAAFFEKYGKSLASWVRGDTSGYYQKAFMKIIN